MPDRPSITLRSATPEDAQAIAAVFDASVRVGWPYLGDVVEQPMFTPAEWDELVATHRPPNALILAEDEAGRVVGFTAAYPEDGEMFLLFVDPAHAGRGIGRTLLEAAHEVLRAGGSREAFLFVHEANERALAVYAAAGYRPDGTDRVTDWRGIALRELRLVGAL
jgi:ribosomal protein S18 acetylase RimI-like enzyme